jgi:hypothetical protein
MGLTGTTWPLSPLHELLAEQLGQLHVLVEGKLLGVGRRPPNCLPSFGRICLTGTTWPLSPSHEPLAEQLGQLPVLVEGKVLGVGRDEDHPSACYQQGEWAQQAPRGSCHLLTRYNGSESAN